MTSNEQASELLTLVVLSLFLAMVLSWSAIIGG
jgi:hypothetical protein